MTQRSSKMANVRVGARTRGEQGHPLDCAAIVQRVQWRMAHREPRPGEVAGILLAAGASARMGTDKLLLRLHGMTLVRRGAITAAAAGLDPVVVVVRRDAGRLGLELDGLAVRTQPVVGDRGIADSLRAGIEAVPAAAAAAVVLLGDMPLVTPLMIAELVQVYRGGQCPIVASDYEGVVAPPALYDHSLFPELQALTGDSAGKEVIERHRNDVCLVRRPRSALQDVDLPSDFERLRAQAETHG